MVVGGSDTGKSSLARYIFQRLCSMKRRTAFLDGDPGQGMIGLPSTLSLALGEDGSSEFPPRGRMWTRFVGSLTPCGHLVEMIVGAEALRRTACERGAQAVVYDTSGFIDPRRGAVTLKSALTDLMQPETVFVLQRHREMDWLVEPLRRLRFMRILELQPSPAVSSRNQNERRSYRREKFSRYFASGRPVRISWRGYAVLPGPDFQHNQLVALEGEDGFVTALGIVLEVSQASGSVVLFTPALSLDGVGSIRLGNVTVDPKTYHNCQLDATFHAL